jgi:hypothetical protein
MATPGFVTELEQKVTELATIINSLPTAVERDGDILKNADLRGTLALTMVILADLTEQLQNKRS